MGHLILSINLQSNFLDSSIWVIALLREENARHQGIFSLKAVLCTKVWPIKHVSPDHISSPSTRRIHMITFFHEYYCKE